MENGFGLSLKLRLAAKSEILIFPTPIALDEHVATVFGVDRTVEWDDRQRGKHGYYVHGSQWELQRLRFRPSTAAAAQAVPEPPGNFGS